MRMISPGSDRLVWTCRECVENNDMEFFHPEGLVAGFHAEAPDAQVPELAAVGEQWTPAHRQMGWHQHEHWEFYLQIDGQTLRRDASGTHEMRPNQLFIAPPRVRHRVVNR